MQVLQAKTEWKKAIMYTTVSICLIAQKEQISSACLIQIKLPSPAYLSNAPSYWMLSPSQEHDVSSTASQCVIITQQRKTLQYAESTDSRWELSFGGQEEKQTC